jgi:hypothetical protein
VQAIASYLLKTYINVWHPYTVCPTRYRTQHFFKFVRVATIRRTTDTHHRHALQTHTTDTFLFISHTTNALLFKFLSNIFIGVRIIKEMPGSVASGTLCRILSCSSKCSPSFRFPHQSPLCSSLPSHVFPMHRPSHSLSFVHPKKKYIFFCVVKFMTPLTMQ